MWIMLREGQDGMYIHGKRDGIPVTLSPPTVLFKDSDISGIAFILGFFTQVAFVIGLCVEEE